jgi:AraC-like DNA-binding protein
MVSLAGVLRDVLPLGAAETCSSRHPAVSRARDYIHQNWRENFALSDLARAAGASPSHLVRTFRDQVGMPPAAYRRALRVQAAQRMLRAGEPPGQVAAACGFYDQAHLNRHFKSVTGVTPGRYARCA